EVPLHAPTEQLQTELADAIVLVQRGPRFHSLCGPLHPLGQLGDYVGQVVLLQIVQQLAVEEARSALSRRIFWRCPHSARASLRNSSAPRAVPQLPLRSQPWRRKWASLSTASKG